MKQEKLLSIFTEYYSGCCVVRSEIDSKNYSTQERDTYGFHVFLLPKKRTRPRAAMGQRSIYLLVIYLTRERFGDKNRSRSDLGARRRVEAISRLRVDNG